MHSKTALAGTALALILLAACSGPQQDPAPTTVEAPPAVSDAGGASDAGGTAPESAAHRYAITPPAQPVELTDDCTGEGMHRTALGESADPALPERSGAGLDVVLSGVDAQGRAELTAALDGGDPHPVEPAAVGDTIMIEDWTISVTSICTDEVEFDLVN